MRKLKYPYVFCDIDDTLLTDDRQIDAATKREIAEYVNCGGNFILVTGRNYPAVKSIYQALGLNTPIILNQGYVYAPGEDTMLYCRTMEHSHLLDVCLFLEQRNIYFQLFSGDDIFVKRKTHYSDTYIEKCGVSISETNVALSAYLQAETPVVDKLMIECSETIIDGLLFDLKQSFGNCFAIDKSRSWIIEISAPDNTKGHAVRYVIENAGISKDQCMAIGDSQSDISMFQAAGFAVAVGNAPADVASNAHWVTKTNNEGGVADSLARFAYANNV